MAYTAHDPRVFYDAIVTQLASSTGKDIGKGEAKHPDGSNFNVPYAVLYTQDEDDAATSLADPSDTTVFRWQVTSVGASHDQALWMQQKVRAALLGWIPTVAGITCMPVAREGGFGVRREDPIQPPVFSGGDIFTAFAD